MCIAASEARYKFPQPPEVALFPLTILFSLLVPVYLFLSLPLPPAISPQLLFALYGYVHPESIGRREYTPANPNCWKTFQIPLDMCFGFKYRRASELGRVIQP